MNSFSRRNNKKSAESKTSEDIFGVCEKDFFSQFFVSTQVEIISEEKGEESQIILVQKETGQKILNFSFDVVKKKQFLCYQPRDLVKVVRCWTVCNIFLWNKKSNVEENFKLQENSKRNSKQFCWCTKKKILKLPKKITDWFQADKGSWNQER